MNIILLGKIGCGKSTLAKQLEPFGYMLLMPGTLYRNEYKNKTIFGIRAQAYWGDGNLCPDEMTNELMKNTIEKIGKDNLIFDGYPRTLIQAQFLDNIVAINFIIDLDIPDDISVKRLLKRREIENRPDDTEEIIRQRLNVYHTNNDAIIKYYSSDLARYKLINADRPREDVLEDVKKALGI